MSTSVFLELENPFVSSVLGELVIAELPLPKQVTSIVSKEKDPWNRCQFQCKLCEVIYTDRRNVKSHIVMSHKMNYQVGLIGSNLINILVGI